MTSGAHGAATQNSVIQSQGALGQGLALVEQPVDKSISIARLPDGRIQMLFEAKNESLNWIDDAEGRPVFLAPYPLNPGAADQSAVAYEFRVTPMAKQ